MNTSKYFLIFCFLLAASLFVAIFHKSSGNANSLWLKEKLQGNANKEQNQTHSANYSVILKNEEARNGRSRLIEPVNSTIKWMFPVNGMFEASPVIGPDGTIYVGSHNCKLYAISQYGQTIWTFQTRDIIRNAVALSRDGSTIYLTSADHCIYALTNEGKLKWVYATDGRINSSPAVGNDGRIYFGSHDNFLYALNPDGTLQWKKKLGPISASSPSIDGHGTIYIGSYDSYLYAVRKTGRVKWKLKTDGGLRANPVIGHDGTIYIGSREGTFYAVSPDGSVKWSYKTGNDIRASAAIGKDGTIYIGSWDNNFYAFSYDGKLKWKHKTNGPIEKSALVDSGNNIYVGSWSDKIYAFDPSGNILWTLNGGIINTTSVISRDRTLFICREHCLLAIGELLPEITISTNKKEYKSGKDCLIDLNITNKAGSHILADLKIFSTDNDYHQTLLNNTSLDLLPNSSFKKRLSCNIKKAGNYIITVKLFDQINGNEITSKALLVASK